jgi:hypothetical protein
MKVNDFSKAQGHWILAKMGKKGFATWWKRNDTSIGFIANSTN